MAAYEDMMSNFKELTLLGTSAGVLYWDMETHMPPRGVMMRSEQLGALSKVIHRMAVDPANGELLDKVEKDKDTLDEVGKRNLYLMRKGYNEQTKLPEKLVGDLSQQQAVATEIWKKAKAANDWKMFQPELQKLIDLSINRAELLKDIKGTSTIYDTMIDDFEPMMTADEISKVFAELRDGLIPMTKKFAGLTSKVDTSFLSREIPVDIQRLIADDLCKIVGYDTASEKAGGRIDEVEHPFTTGYYDDVRITVKYHTNKFDSALFAILHEAGHALYEQNLNQEWKYQPLGVAASSGIHESQSRFIENMIGRTPEFWEFYLPRLKKLTGNAFSDVSLSNFGQAMNLVTPSKIRIEADEVTYSLHIIIRFEIERDLFSGKIQVSELPEIWNQKYEEYLGLDIESDTEGVLQDTHWGSGLYGYFPSYALGNVFDGMWYDQMNKDMPNWIANLAKGEILEPIQWHVKNIHTRSNLNDPGDLTKLVTGKELTAKPFLQYLDGKYSKLFS
ncbi:MAG: carboxypeptidase M32 [Candidatus Thorarchaeota archaeon]|nr:carboxypeptidase M32 [Candidatus Thorarchaeota archaeon]